ncbi:hypothetical protein MBLNU230_g0841t1 [Neophaeotheca triangularis]
MTTNLRPQAAATAAAHPKRTPAHRSVSLLHTPRLQSAYQTSDSSTDSNRANKNPVKRKRDSPSSLQPLGRNSSGESSNAERWFENSNNDAYMNKQSVADNDPPFFMRNNSSSETPPDYRNVNQYLAHPDLEDSLPNRTGLLRLGNEGSSTEDFRSVIDDLTIQNKKLKRRLKKYEKLHDRHLKDEKLFEVRIHGLPPAKKQELEETLRTFAAGLGQPGPSSGFPNNGYEGLMPLLNNSKPTYSQTASSSNVHLADSAYASISASGQGSMGQGASGTGKRQRQSAQSAKSRQQNIHSYLHHIPEGLMPQQEPASMSEKSMKKLTVKRLEQIFAGKGAAASGHQQSFQQEEVSQMAARAERNAIEARGQAAGTEGVREACIMDEETEDPLNPASLKRQADSTNRYAEEKCVSENDFAEKLPVEQRPTRPLDLDPHRAQVPDENIRYIRHLGFSPNIDSNRSPVDDYGWIYLNLLINMAQLHTMHVTVDFVRKAIDEYSDKFEVSADGRRVRWRRGASGTTFTSSNDDSSSVGVNTPSGQTPRKRMKLNRGDSNFSKHSNASKARSTQRAQSENKLVYTPLFFHREDSDSESGSSSEVEEDQSAFPQQVGNDSSAMTSSGGLAQPPRRDKKREDGPIIFYNNARFCTDLSGDHNINGNYNAPTYKATNTVPIGELQPAARHQPEKRGPLEQATKLPEPKPLEGGSTPDSQRLAFPPRSPMQSRTKQELQEDRPIELEVSGIGGVCPADNFAIQVSSCHGRDDQDEAPAPPRRKQPRTYPPKIAAILQGSDPTRRTRSAVHRNMQVVTSDTKELPPSELPPALSFMPFDTDSYGYGDDENSSTSDASDAMSITPASNGGFHPSTAPQAMEIASASSSEADSESGYSDPAVDADADDTSSDAESDGSLDLLASAREHDPEAIFRKEREYDANMAERLAEEIPAGSSAATAGGGSGFASPASGVAKAEYRRAIRDARAAQGVVAAEGEGKEEEKKEASPQAPGLQREDTGSSMVVHGREGSVGAREE